MATKTKTATTAPAMKLLTTTAAIETALKSIFTRGQSLQADIHLAACSILQQIGVHSDVRLVNSLLAAMPEAARKNAMRDWFVKFGPVMFEGDKPVFVKGGKVKLGDAMAMPFWKLTPEPDYVALDISKFLASVEKKLVKDQKETGVDHSQLIRKVQLLTATGTTGTA